MSKSISMHCWRYIFLQMLSMKKYILWKIEPSIFHCVFPLQILCNQDVIMWAFKERTQNSQHNTSKTSRVYTDPCRLRSPCRPCHASTPCRSACSWGWPGWRGRRAPRTAARRRGPSAPACSPAAQRCPQTWWQSLGQNTWNFIWVIHSCITQKCDEGVIERLTSYYTIKIIWRQLTSLWIYNVIYLVLVVP